MLLWLWFLGRSQDTETPTPNQDITSNTPTGSSSGYASNVTVSPGGVKPISAVTANPGAKAGSVQAVFSLGTYSPGSNSYVLSGGSYSPGSTATGGVATYTVNGGVISGGVYNSADNTYALPGGVYNSVDNTYTYPLTSDYTLGGIGDTGTGVTISNPGVIVTPTTPGSPGTPGTIASTTIVVTPPPPSSTSTTPVVVTPVDTVAPVGAVWIPNTGSPFIPTAINSIGSANPTGNGSIFFPQPLNIDGTGNVGNSAIEGIIAAGAVGAITCAFITAQNIEAATEGGTTAAGTAGGYSATNVWVVDHANAIIAGTIGGLKGSELLTDDWWSCLARKAARIVLQQITVSVVNWINSGFNGKPSFVQNYQQFFGNVADQAAGSFIQGSGLAFLCSPFSLQVKIAIAYAYAQRNAAPSCSLTQVIGNVNSFMNGNFSAGGWPGLISFTAVPTNNAFGAYAFGTIALNSAVLNAKANAASTISPSGFIGLQKVNSCPNSRDGPNPGGNIQVTSSSDAKVGCPLGCNCSITTPGAVISDALGATNQSTLDSVNLSKSFDEIISALISQLIVKTLREGLSSLSNNGAGYGSDQFPPEQAAAAAAATTLLEQMQRSVTLAQQYAQIQQSEIADIQQSQVSLNEVASCFDSASTASAVPADKQALAKTSADEAKAKIASLEAEVGAHNEEIAKANAAIARLQQLQSALLSASVPADVQSVKANYDSALAGGSFYTSTDITNAQQDRTSLLSRLAAVNTDASTKLTQCYALGN